MPHPSRHAGGRAFLASIAIVLMVNISDAADSGATRSEELEDVVARANGEAITWAQLHRVQVDLVALQQQVGDSDAIQDGLQDLALKNLIQRRLLLQEAARRELSVSEDEFDEALLALRHRFSDLDSLGVWMQRRGFTDGSLIDTIRGDLLVQRVTAALLTEVTVTEEQTNEYYEAHKTNLVIGEEIRLRIIVVSSAMAAKQVVRALRNGENFSHLARQLSQGRRATEGGDTGWVDLLTLPLLVRQAVAMLKEGEAAGPLEKSADEFLIVALDGRRPRLAKNLHEAQPEIERRLLAAKKQETITEWLAEQEQKSKIELFL